jgi:hypothetical protein
VNANPRPSPDVVHQELDGEVVLVHLGTNRVYALNETGARLWALLCAGYDPPRIREQLSREFDVDPAELQREVDAMLESLAGAGLVAYPEG